MKPTSTVTFIQELKEQCWDSGWSHGATSITRFTLPSGDAINLIENYGQITAADLRVQCEPFAKVGGLLYESRARQNNKMMSLCLHNTLTVEARSRLAPYRAEFTFDDIIYAPLMFKTIMRLATIDSVATTEALRANLRELPTYTTTVQGDIQKIHSYFNENYSQLIARGSTIDDAVGILFDAYRVVPCQHFKTYIIRKHDAYLDGELHGLTHETLMAMANDKYSYLKNKGLWGVAPAEEQLVAMAAELEKLRGHLKLKPNLAKAADGTKKKDKDGKKTKNKKSGKDKKDQKVDEAWKKVAPAAGEPKTKKIKDKTYHWCVHHMAWTIHSVSECKLGAEQIQQQTTPASTVAHSAIVSAAATTINPSYAAMLANMARCAADE